jgi:hypothetical protein
MWYLGLKVSESCCPCLCQCDGGRAIAQAVSRRLPTAAARVRDQVRLCGICGGQSGTGAGFLRVLRFLPANSDSTDCSTFIIRRLGLLEYRPVSGRRTKWTPSDSTPRRRNVMELPAQNLVLALTVIQILTPQTWSLNILDFPISKAKVIKYYSSAMCVKVFT